MLDNQFTFHLRPIDFSEDLPIRLSFHSSILEYIVIITAHYVNR